MVSSECWGASYTLTVGEMLSGAACCEPVVFHLSIFSLSVDFPRTLDFFSPLYLWVLFRKTATFFLWPPEPSRLPSNMLLHFQSRTATLKSLYICPLRSEDFKNTRKCLSHNQQCVSSHFIKLSQTYLHMFESAFAGFVCSLTGNMFDLLMSWNSQ